MSLVSIGFTGNIIINYLIYAIICVCKVMRVVSSMGNITQIEVSIITPQVLHTRFAFRCSSICFFINGTNNIIHNTRYFLGPCGAVLSTIVPTILFFRDMLNGHKTCDWLLTQQRAGKSPGPPDKIFLSTLCQQGGKLKALKAIYRL